MKLDPVAEKILANSKASGAAPVYTLDVESARKAMAAGFISKEEPEFVASVVDDAISCVWGQMPVRVYNPKPNEALPLLVYFHGGGWTINSIETHDSVCRRLANTAEVIIASVEYRLAPEHKFPAQIYDAYDAVQWALANAETLGSANDKVYVFGDSSGSTQAAVVCQLMRDRGDNRIAGQVLIYPPTDYYLPYTESYKEFGEEVIIDRDFMVWSWNNYLESNEDLNNPYVCPLRAKEFDNLPKAFVAVAECDVLRDEVKMYANKMKEAGNQVELISYEGMLHGFFMQWRIMDQSIDLYKRIGEFVKQ